MINEAVDKRLFLYPTLAAVFALGIVFIARDISAVFIALLLIVLEVTLSFDNAIVNAKVLKDMSPVWQYRFLTWGIAMAVVGTRVVLPILIVSAVAMLSPIVVTHIALSDPGMYSSLLEHSHYAISAFGAAFLLMVSLKFFFDVEKQIHWIRQIERHLSRWGDIEAIEVALVLTFLLVVSALVPLHAATILTAGSIGVVLFIVMEGLTSAMRAGSAEITRNGLVGFMYLNTLDSAFSLDGVVGAFAITTDLLTIAAGLGVGAYFVRTMTVYLVRTGTIASLRYLEHGAHWAIFGLGISMVVSLVTPVPQVVTAVIGLVFIGASYISSVRVRVTI